MELHGDEPGMRRQLCDLDELAIWRSARHPHAVLRQRRLVQAVELEAVAMTLVDQALAVDLFRERSLHQLARVTSQAHRSTQVINTHPIAKLVDHPLRR